MMSRYIIIALFLLASFYSGSFATRIIGGSDANIADFPYMLSIELEGTGHYCGGVIVAANWALTDAWCSLSPDTRKFKIRSGSAILGNGTLHNIVQWNHHPQSNVFYMEYDFALLRVDPPFEFGENVAVVGLPVQDQDTEDGTVALIAGWGELYEGSGNLTTPHLQFASLEVYGTANCTDYLAIFGHTYHESMLCARDPNEQVANCWRDEGGPLVVDDVLIGITLHPGVCNEVSWVQMYSRVANIRDWIDETVTA